MSFCGFLLCRAFGFTVKLFGHRSTDQIATTIVKNKTTAHGLFECTKACTKSKGTLIYINMFHVVT